ncbi:MAG: TadE/TadG family type IV pilus assembly protein [Hyphomicrobiales bacterium]
MSKFSMKNWKSFKADQKGNFAVLTAVALPVVAFAIGSAVDLANYRIASTATQAAVDSASLAASRAITVEDASLAQATSIAREQLSLNISNVAFVDAQAVENSLRIEQDLTTGTVTASADVQTPTLFAGLFGFDNISGTLSSTNQVQSLEIAFVLDNTGSMRSSIAGGVNNNERINALRGAMTNAVDLLLPLGRTNDKRVRASIVPYSSAVNVGQFYEAAVGPNAPDRGSTCVTEREGVNTFEDIVADENDIDTLFETDATLAPQNCLTAELLPLTGDRDELFASINSLTPRGVTAGHNGVTWGINTISSEWQSFWSEDARPADYLTSNVRKILVVMTDGEFNSTFFDTDVAAGRNILNARGSSESAALEYCDLAKDASRGVIVYTVTLGDNSRAQDLMEQCASSPATALVATSAEELDEAFERIVVEARTPILTN